MADKKISDLTELTTPDGTEELVVNDGGTSKKITQANLFKLGDNVKATFGSSAGGDLEIYHNGSNSYINDKGAGDLYIKSGNDIRLQDSIGRNYFKAAEGGAAKIYDAGVSKIETRSTGAIVYGQFKIQGAGTAALPSLTLNDSNTGFYDGGDNNIAASCNGAKVLDITPDGLTVGTTAITDNLIKVVAANNCRSC